MNKYILEFVWTVSRGHSTYGYNICTAYLCGVKSGQCNGGGYDMQGTAMASALLKYFPEQLKAYTLGSYHYGASGQAETLLKAIDPNFRKYNGKNSTIYTFKV